MEFTLSGTTTDDRVLASFKGFFGYFCNRQPVYFVRNNKVAFYCLCVIAGYCNRVAFFVNFVCKIGVVVCLLGVIRAGKKRKAQYSGKKNGK